MRGRAFGSLALTLVLAVCSDEDGLPTSPLRTGNLEFTATSGVTRGSIPMLHAAMRLRNVGTEPVTLETGGCPVLLYVYEAPRGMSRPIWDARHSLCPGSLLHVTLEPDESRTFKSGAPVNDILGGRALKRVSVAATLRIAGRDDVVLPAGEVDLVPND